MSDQEKEPKKASGDFGKGRGSRVDFASKFEPVGPLVKSKLNVKALVPNHLREVEKSENRSVASVSKPQLRKYAVRKPVGKVVYLDPAKAFGKKEEVRFVFSSKEPTPISDEALEKSSIDDKKVFESKKKIEVTPRYTSVKPVALDWKMVYSAAGFDLDDVELTLNDWIATKDDVPKFKESFQGKSDKSAKPIIPDPDRVAELTKKKVKSADQIEVLGPERVKNDGLSVPETKSSKWAFWKRPSKRDQQLARISEGYLEMVDLVRSIRGQLDSQNENNMILSESLAHLPQAIKGLDQGIGQLSKSQLAVGKALVEIHTQLKSSNERDERLANSMDGFNHTLKCMDETSKETMKTFDRAQERMKDSDVRMENFFQNVQNTEEKVSETMARLQRNMALMHYVFLGCLIVVIGVLVFSVVTKKEQTAPPQAIELIKPKSGSENK